MFTTGEAYHDLGGDYFQRRDPERHTHPLVKRLKPSATTSGSNQPRADTERDFSSVAPTCARNRPRAHVPAVGKLTRSAGYGAKRTRISPPPPGALAASTLPPCASAAWRTIARPRPDPGMPREPSAR